MTNDELRLLNVRTFISEVLSFGKWVNECIRGKLLFS